MTPESCFDFSYGYLHGYYENMPGCSKDLIVPEKIGNTNLKGISMRAFNNTNLKSVKITSGNISDFTFSNNSNLQKIDISNVKKIKHASFSDNPKLTVAIFNKCGWNWAYSI